MSPDDIKHFLIAYDVTSGKTDVREFGTDYDAAIAAYNEAERENEADSVDIVLLSSDSLATIKRTHSSYFAAGRERKLDELLSSV